MPPRKRYLEYGADIADLPYTTKKRSFDERETDLQAPDETDECTPAESDDLLPAERDGGSSAESDDHSVPAESDDHSVPAESDDDSAPAESDDSLASSPSATRATPPPPTPQPGGSPGTRQEPQEEAELTANDLLALSVGFIIEFGLPWKAVETLQKMMSYVLKRCDVPATKYLFKKNAGITVETAKFHFYCNDCKRLVASTSGRLADRNAVQAPCPNCGKLCDGRQMLIDGHFFLSMPIRKQITELLSREEISSALTKRLQEIDAHHDNGSDGMSDISDGDAYKAVREKMDLHDLTLTINSDGSPLFNSSKYSIWPVQVMINELPPHLRHKNVLVTMLWYGQTHPDMPLLLTAFVDQMEDLSCEGITWEAGTRTVCSKIHCFSCCADAPARAIMQNMLQYNGHYGCGWCLHPGTVINGTVKYTVDEVVEDRDTDRTLALMKRAAASDKPIKGVKGPTPLMNLPRFDVIWGFTPDYMHCVLLGTTRQLTELWLTSVGEDFYIGCPALFDALDQRLLSMKPPSCFHRLQRSLSVRKYWKATEWQQWLLCFSLPCLDGILHSKFLCHFALLVKGIYLLLQDNVTKGDVTESINCLVKFVVDVQVLYDEKQMTFNIHQMLHLSKSVLHQGPLWAHSCFAFESNIGQVKELVTSAKGVPLQIVERLMMRSLFPGLKALACPETQSFLSGGSVSNRGTVAPLGKPRQVPLPLLELAQSQIGHIISGQVMEHDRVAVSQFVFHSEQYGRPNKTDCTAAILPSKVYIKIKHLLSFQDTNGQAKIFAVSPRFVTTPVQKCTHIVKARQVPPGHAASNLLVEIAPGVVPCVYMHTGANSYFVSLAFKALFRSE
ncbi:uncharacterized protein LOC121836570 [Ixodes scapularis]|uniref:uncharacterized protein LOC121836570 n=1 Tax=Ixodes scapularis TaxID=6945 RepID=UPI001C38E6ED|nr:uncharacterized protein LOC121836570 [Ixodes scapularis]